MITSSNGNIFRVTGPLWGESTDSRWIPLTKASDGKFWCFFYLRLSKRLSNLDAGDLRRHCVHYDVIVMNNFENVFADEMYSMLQNGFRSGNIIQKGLNREASRNFERQFAYRITEATTLLLHILVWLKSNSGQCHWSSWLYLNQTKCVIHFIAKIV